ncbi:saccharopine dehydrogenase family protein [Zunongwangia sp. HRR-M8]|uniref:saccharopine dehydrogenase family protein n=1 Tax=Zunongwangia sp. HRR-M8 TaxID=3015170 RepID=UPI0022DDA484|nr:saccharopine dehydrogenase family protein [Zunongwangia sp. HRR-M8]WBL22105.1 saccharopine dehydrogenase NADP-binding domain-containing protein [Zunongwangia sp. HRR-M8]
MQQILLIGAGKSTAVLIKYLSEKSSEENFTLLVADKDLSLAKKAVQNHQNCHAISFDIFNAESCETYIAPVAIVISMLPARFHIKIAKVCLKLKKNLVTASYITAEMKALDVQVKKAGLIFMNEIGVDPGIDHMSAMHIIDRIRDNGGKIIMFESFCGGLIAPENDTNLWNYKFTWNPRNVVVAGQGGVAEFIQEGKYKYIPYHRLFRRTEFLDIENYGRFEAYANRNSLDYRKAYGLDDVLTLYRGTIRRVGFSRAWNMFVQLGMTDDSFTMENSEDMTYREFVNSFLPYSPTDSVELKLRHNLKIDQDDSMWEKLLDIDLFNPKKTIGIKNATPAHALQKILEEQWKLASEDKDMLVMYHKLGYEIKGKKKQIDATMVCIGKNQTETAMAKTVGLPVGIATIKILKKEITTPGVHLPISREVYEPILRELQQNGINFKEKQTTYLGYNPIGGVSN